MSISLNQEIQYITCAASFEKMNKYIGEDKYSCKVFDL